VIPTLLFLAITPMDAITFAANPRVAYLPIRDVAKAKGWKLNHDPVTGLSELDGKPLPVNQPRLFDGTLIMPAQGVPVQIGKKRVLVDLSRQEISAWQGQRLVMHTKISSGRNLKDTPPGTYRTGLKETMHISSIYGSKMPFSVHLRGNYFIHGSEQTQTGPGSHGCVRLPLYNNAAQWFFSWVEPGTGVKVQGRRPKHRTK
jgi:hypothetical protein